MVTPVKNQENCGSCWAFASTACFESQVLFKNGPMVVFSEEFTLECTYALEKGYPGSCGGGLFYNTMSLLAKRGGAVASKYPYVAGDYGDSQGFPTTRGICEDTSRIILNVTYASMFISTDDDLKTALSNYGPLAVGIQVVDGFYSYRNGVFYDPQCVSAQSLNHAVLLVGYDASGNWIIKNSWGSSWGDNGYMVVSKAATCGLKLDVNGFV